MENEIELAANFLNKQELLLHLLHFFFFVYFACNFLLRLLQSIPRFAVKFDILLFIDFHPYDNIFCCNINIYIYILALSYYFLSHGNTFLFFFFGFFDDSSKLFIIYLTV